MKRFFPIIPRGIALAVLFSALAGCRQKTVATPQDSPRQGTIHISVDETFKPVIDDEISMYENTYPGTKIIAHYKPEADCIRDILSDSATRMVIVTRGLNSKEEQYFMDSLNYVPGWNNLASDAVVVLVNAASTDTVYTMERLRSLLEGRSPKKQPVVLDGFSATSTVRYVLDTLLQGRRPDTSVLRAVRGSRAVIDYVASDPAAIGLVGFSWIGNPEISEQVNALKKVRMAYVSCQACGDTLFVKPTQYGILANRYPLVRGLYYILKENFTGLGTGFMNFLIHEQGQLIFRRAYLGPARMGFAIRSVRINEHLQKD